VVLVSEQGVQNGGNQLQITRFQGAPTFSLHASKNVWDYLYDCIIII